MRQGLIQSVFELHDGSGIVVTVGKYVTPNHKDINGNGIEPDYRRIPGATHIHPFSFVPLMYIMQLTLNFLLWQISMKPPSTFHVAEAKN